MAGRGIRNGCRTTRNLIFFILLVLIGTPSGASGFQDYTLTIVCDDDLTLWIDGNLREVAGQDAWDDISTLKISSKTRVLAVKCHNAHGGPHGIMGMVQDEAGNTVLVTDDSWKCSNRMDDGWLGVNFPNQSKWKTASYNYISHREYDTDDGPWRTISSRARVIWTGQEDDRTVYCRKVITNPVSSCTNLPSSWFYLQTSENFPVTGGKVFVVQCKQGFVKVGDRQITCETGEQFSFGVKPQCIDPSQNYFEVTDISNENVEEYAGAIKQFVEQNITARKLTTAAAALEKLTKSAGVQITNETISLAIEAVNLMNLHNRTEKNREEDARSASKIVDSTADLASKLHQPEGGTVSSIKSQSVGIAAIRPPAEGQNDTDGEIVASFSDTEDGIDIAITRLGLQRNDSITPKTLVKIDARLASVNKTVWFTSFSRNSSLFKSETNFKITSQIIGAGIGERTEAIDSEVEITMTFNTNINVQDVNALCQYWDVQDGVGRWSSEGMTFLSKTKKSVICKSSRLTNFAVLINPSNSYFTGTEELVLQMISMSGCSLSVIGLIVTIVGLAGIREIRSVLSNKVHIGLAVSLLFAYISLLAGPNLIYSESACYFSAVFTHYCFLCVFCWMLCEAVNLYLGLVVVFSNYSKSKVFMKFSFFSVVTPFIIVMMTITVDVVSDNEAYIVRNSASGVRIVCWLVYRARMVSLLLPLVLIMCTNIVIFVLVMKVLCNKSNSASKRLRSAVAVSTLIGLSWIVGFFALGEASFVVNVIFAVCNSVQGVLICYLYCFSKSDVVSRWTCGLSKSSKGTKCMSTTILGAGDQKRHARLAVNNVTKESSLPRSKRGNTSLNAKSMEIYASISSVPDEENLYDHLSRGSPATPRKQTKSVTLPRNLQEGVRKKVVVYEEITYGEGVLVISPQHDSST